MELFGVEWVGLTAENGHKLIVSLIFIAVCFGFVIALKGVVSLLLRSTDQASVQTKFWTRQAIGLFTAIVLILGLLSIWFNDPKKMASVFGLMSAGLAFALQQVVTSIAGYFVILRGSNFTIGDRISMGGVRGDVLRLGFVQTTIMEMGEPPSVQGADPAMWIKSRQFTGRIVTVSNSKIFSEPVFNYTRDFPFIWEEMMIPITYKADRARVEQILLEAARQHAVDPNSLAAEMKKSLEDRFNVTPIDLPPRVYFRLTDNWLELTVRFLIGTHLIRSAKDAMSRYVVDELDKAGIGIASATYDIVGFPTIDVRYPPSIDVRPEPAGASASQS